MNLVTTAVAVFFGQMDLLTLMGECAGKAQP
jgi:hypothetical protein